MMKFQKLGCFTLCGIWLSLIFTDHASLAATLGPVSEERPPVACDPGWFLSEIHCTGSYCDNIKISCARLPDASLGASEWRPWVSEEQGTSQCSANRYIAGLACNGKYCDNLSLFCVEVINYRSSHCFEMRTISEEGGGKLSFFEGVDTSGQYRVAKGMRCSGKYCDNKKFTVCEVGKR